jgi:hypothetical protein
MASHTAPHSQHATLTGGAADTVEITASGAGWLIRNRATTGDGIFYKWAAVIDSMTDNNLTAPVADADDTYLCPAGQTIIWGDSPFSGGLVVKLISATSDAFDIESW